MKGKRKVWSLKLFPEFDLTHQGCIHSQMFPRLHSNCYSSHACFLGMLELSSWKLGVAMWLVSAYHLRPGVWFLVPIALHQSSFLPITIPHPNSVACGKMTLLPLSKFCGGWGGGGASTFAVFALSVCNPSKLLSVTMASVMSQQCGRFWGDNCLKKRASHKEW